MDKKSTDNRANQLNPNNDTYWSSRNTPAPAPAAQPNPQPSAPASGSSNGTGGTQTCQK